MKIFIVIFGSAFVGEIIQSKYSVLDAEHYCQVWNGFLLITGPRKVLFRSLQWRWQIKQTIKLNIITPYNLWLSAVLPKVNSLVTQRCETPFRTASAVVWLYLPVLGSETILRSTTICTIMLSKVIKWHIEPRAGEATWSLKVLRWTGAPFFFYPLGWSNPD